MCVSCGRSANFASNYDLLAYGVVPNIACMSLPCNGFQDVCVHCSLLFSGCASPKKQKTLEKNLEKKLEKNLEKKLEKMPRKNGK